MELSIGPREVTLHSFALVLAVGLTVPVAGWQVLVDVNAPEFTVRDADGRAVSSRDLAGKVVLLDFWATWCAPCVRELPELAEYHRRVTGRRDVAFLSLNVTDERETLVAFLAERKIPYPVQSGDSLLGPLEVSVFPTKLILDLRGEGGRVRLRRRGYTPLASLEAAMAQVLATP